jgi:hypothetical protein
MKFRHSAELLRNITALTGLFYIAPIATAFLLRPSAELVMSSGDFVADIAKSLLGAVAVSLVLLGRSHFTRRRNAST